MKPWDTLFLWVDTNTKVDMIKLTVEQFETVVNYISENFNRKP